MTSSSLDTSSALKPFTVAQPRPPVTSVDIVPESRTERFHRLLYLGIQRVRGRPLGPYLNQFREWERLPAQEFTAMQARRLRARLLSARASVPHYSSERWNRALSGHDSGILEAWPVLERAAVQQHVDDLLARPQVEDTYTRTTSGSTGRPVRIGVSPEAAAWAWANEYRAMEWFGVPLSARALMLRSDPQSALLNWIQNRKVVSAGDLSPESLDEALRFLETKRPVYVWGYTSALAELARHARQAGSGSIPLARFAKVYGEMLFPFQRQQIEQDLGATVIGTYGCQETGTAAHECPLGSMHVLSEHVVLEILRDGEPVAPGEMGDIVLTCLTNDAMPMIRYQVGDRGRLSPEPCACGRPHPVLADVEGRIGDVLLTETGRAVHGSSLGAVLKHVLAANPPGAIGKVLFEQQSPQSWKIFVESGPGFASSVPEQLANGVRGIFGAGCRVDVALVDTIPREPSGKFRYYRRATNPTVPVIPRIAQE